MHASPRRRSGRAGSPDASTEANPTGAPSAAPSFGQSFGTLQVFPPGLAIEIVVRELKIRHEATMSSKRREILLRGQALIAPRLPPVGHRSDSEQVPRL